MTEEIEVSEDEREELGGDPPAPDDIEPVVEDEDEDPSEQLPDYSHEEEPEPESEPQSEPEDAVTHLKRQIEELTGQKQQAETRAVMSELEGNRAVVASARAAAQTALETAEAAYAAAASKGDWTAAAKAQREIAAAVADVREFEDAEAEIKARIEQSKRAPARQTERQQPADAFDAAIASMTPQAQAWCRKNKADLTSDPKRGARAQAGHLLAVSEGLTADTPEYFAFLDKHMGYQVSSKTDAGGRRETPAAKKPTGKPRVAAPAGGRTAATGSPREVTLSKAEVAMARTMGMSIKDYAKHKAEIIENGKDPSRTGLRYSSQTHHSQR
jgi:hypothetical protein